MDFLVSKGRNIRAAVFDLDGTLLRSDKTVSDRTLSAIKAIVAKGWYTAVATGRHPLSALRYMEYMGVLNERSLAICFNGSALVNVFDFKKSGSPDQGFKTLYEQTASKDEAAILADLATHFSLHTHAYSKYSGLCVENSNIYSMREFFHAGVGLHDGFDFKKAPESERYYKLITVGNWQDLDCFRASLSTYLKDRFEIMRTDENFIEFIPSHCSKGTALMWLCKAALLNIPQICAFGDAENDMLMLEKAGLGVAMGNATAALRKIADHVTTSNDDDGIAVVLEHLLQLQDRE